MRSIFAKVGTLTFTSGFSKNFNKKNKLSTLNERNLFLRKKKNEKKKKQLRCALRFFSKINFCGRKFYLAKITFCKSAEVSSF